jgi:hypothetical protein
MFIGLIFSGMRLLSPQKCFKLWLEREIFGKGTGGYAVRLPYRL